MHIFSIIAFEKDFKIVDNALMAMKTANNSIVGIDFGFNGDTLPLGNKMCNFPPYTAKMIKAYS